MTPKFMIEVDEIVGAVELNLAKVGSIRLPWGWLAVNQPLPSFLRPACRSAGRLSGLSRAVIFVTQAPLW